MKKYLARNLFQHSFDEFPISAIFNRCYRQLKQDYGCLEEQPCCPPDWTQILITYNLSDLVTYALRFEKTVA
jgi:hypothetical protein